MREARRSTVGRSPPSILADGMPSPVEFTFRVVGAAGPVTVDTHEQNIRLARWERTDFLATPNRAPSRFADFVAAPFRW